MIITLKGFGFEAKINSDRGANCFSLRKPDLGVSVLREPNYDEPLDNPYLYGMPLLFPQNRISGGAFEFEGRAYDFGVNEPSTGCYIHGVLHETPFEVVEVGEDFARLRYRSYGRYVGYSEDFAVEVCYRLTESGLKIGAEIENLSDHNMPVFFAYHTTFNLPFVSGGKAEDVRVFAEIGDEIERDMSVYLPTGRIVPHDSVSSAIRSGEFRSVVPISRHYKAAGSGAIALYDEGSGVAVEYRNGREFGFRLVYNGNADGYICIEPQTSAADAPNGRLGREYSGFSWIEGQGKREFLSEIRVFAYGASEPLEGK